MIPYTPPRSVVHRSLPTLALGFVLLVCLCLAAMEAWREAAAYQGEIRDAKVQSLNLTKSLAQHADDSFAMAEIMLAGLVERVETDGISPEALDRLNRLLAAQVADQPRVRGLFVYDEEGRWLASSATGATQGFNNGDRTYFKHHQTSADRSAYLGTPVRSRSGGQWIVTLTRRLQHADGSFAGVVLASLDVSYFTDFYRRFDVGQDGNVILVRTDGPILARLPFDDAYAQTSLAGSELLRLLPGKPVGTREYTSPLDGVARISGFQRAARYPIVLQVAVARDAVLAPWRREAAVRAGAVVALILLVALTGVKLVSQVRRRQAAEAALAVSEGEFRLLAENASDMVSRIARDGLRRYVSPSCQALLGYAPEQLVGRSVLEGVDTKDLPALERQIATLRAGKAAETTVTYRARRIDGETIWLEATVRVAYDPATGLPDGVVAVTRDITARKRLETELATLAHRDGLTSVANRRAFDARLSADWSRATVENTALSLLLIDVDRFKRFNDHYGHQAGDACLRAVAQTAQATASRPDDLVARYGGEEFAVLLPNTDAAGALATAQRVRQAIEALARAHAENPPSSVVTVSVGVVTYDPIGAAETLADPVALIEAADRALYEAKRQGRNRVSYSSGAARAANAVSFA